MSYSDDDPSTAEGAARAARKPGETAVLAACLADLLHALDTSVSATERGSRLAAILTYYEDSLRSIRRDT